ncbi:IS3 family transposase [Paenibacillus sp. LjRoot153]
MNTERQQWTLKKMTPYEFRSHLLSVRVFVQHSPYGSQSKGLVGVVVFNY